MTNQQKNATKMLCIAECWIDIFNWLNCFYITGFFEDETQNMNENSIIQIACYYEIEMCSKSNELFHWGVKKTDKKKIISMSEEGFLGNF